MTGKEFLFSLDLEKLFSKYFKDYYENDIILAAKAEKEGFDKKKTIRAGFEHLMEQLKEIETIPNDKYFLLALPGYDYDMEDDLSYKIYRIYDICLLDPTSIKNKGILPRITSKKEIPKEFLFETYSLMFLSWEELLSYEMYYIPENEEDKYGAAAYYVHELSWFGYDKKTVEENMASEREKLDEAIEECKDPSNLKTFRIEDLYEELGIEPPTPEENALRDELTEKVIVKSYNEKIAIYNKYFVPQLK